MSTSPSPTHVPRVPSTGLLLALAAAVVAAYVTVWLVGLDLSVRPPLPARFQADHVTGLISLVADLTARLGAVGTLGLFVAALGSGLSAGALTDRGRRFAARGSRAAQLWFAASVLNTFANPAYVNGVGMHTTLTPGSWWTFLWASPSALAWLFSALVALGCVVAGYVSRRWATFALSWAAGVAALLFVSVTGNVTVGLDHDWATDAAVVLTLTAVPLLSLAVGTWLLGTDAAARGYQRVALPLLLLATAGQAVIAWQQLAGFPILATPFGLWQVTMAVIAALWLASWALRAVRGPAPGAGIGRDVVLAVAYLAALTAENHVPSPRFLEPQTPMINYLGYEVQIGPTIERLVTLGRPNLLWVIIVVAAIVWYVAAWLRARRLGRPYPVPRLIAWCAAWLLTLFLAVTGLWEYSTVQYSWHMVVHMTVNMMVPVLAVLGAPLGLIRAASDPKPGRVGAAAGLDALEASRPWQIMTSPLVAWLLYVGSLFMVYFTPAFSWLMKYHWAHQLMLLFFMATGYLFFDQIIGSDKVGRQLPHLLKLALVISIMPFHAIFAVSILSSRTLIGADFYQTISAPWITDLLAEQNIAGQATWFLGEVPLFLVIAALAAQWFRADSSEAAEFDAAEDAGDDDSHDAYNDMLAELARRDRQADREAHLRKFQP